MYLMFADESGDSGLIGSPANYFVLNAVIVHELEWRKTLDEIVEFRRELRRDYGLKLRHEIHSRQLITKPGELAFIPKHRRLEILRKAADKLAQITTISIISIAVNKTGKPVTYDVFENAWLVMIQRFENTISHKNFPPSGNSRDGGLISCDKTDEKRLTQLVRKMRHYNPIPNNQFHGMGYRNITLKHLVDDPVFRDSANSFLIQCADICAYLLYQKLSPCRYMKKKGGHNYFDRLRPVLCLKASSTDPLGIVRL
jgi:hypothetical protein